MKTAKTALLALTLATAPLAMADHNSRFGEGWANMPNDVHDTRIDTLDSDDPTDFVDFVRQGNGADSVRDSDYVARGGMASGAGGGMGGSHK